MKSANYKVPHYAFFLEPLVTSSVFNQVFSSAAYLLICSSFDNAFQFSDYIASNKRAISE
jgi:hypothetical protein